MCVKAMHINLPVCPSVMFVWLIIPDLIFFPYSVSAALSAPVVWLLRFLSASVWFNILSLKKCCISAKTRCCVITCPPPSAMLCCFRKGGEKKEEGRGGRRRRQQQQHSGKRLTDTSGTRREGGKAWSWCLHPHWNDRQIRQLCVCASFVFGETHLALPRRRSTDAAGPQRQ